MYFFYLYVKFILQYIKIYICHIDGIRFQQSFEMQLQNLQLSDSFITFYHQCDQLDNTFICIMV